MQIKVVSKFFLALVILTFAGIVYFYLVINDSISKNQEEDSIGTKLPYVLTVTNTNKDYKFSTANITVTTVNNSNVDLLDLVMLNPHGRIYTKSLENKSAFTFPVEFKNDSMPVEQGQYEIILYNASDKSNITSVKFNVAKTDFLNSISHRIFGQNVLPAIATLSIPLAWIIKNIVTFYQKHENDLLDRKKKDEQDLLDKKKQIEQDLLKEEEKKEKAIEKSKLKLEKKLTWTQQNMKYYLNMGKEIWYLID